MLGKRNWISGAINPKHKGQFKKKAQKAGESTREFAEQEQGKGGKTGAQARLALTLMGMHHKGK